MIAHPESTQGINPYSYVENNPLNKTDPTGEARCPPDCGFAWDMMSATDGTSSAFADTGSSWADYHQGSTGPDAGSSGNGSASGPASGMGDGPVQKDSPSTGTHNPNADNDPSKHQITMQSKEDTVHKNIEKQNGILVDRATGDTISGVTFKTVNGIKVITINVNVSAVNGKVFDQFKAGVDAIWNGKTFQIRTATGAMETVKIVVNLTRVTPLQVAASNGNTKSAFSLRGIITDSMKAEGGDTNFGNRTITIVTGGLNIDSIGKMNAAAHEFGHALGLGDAYTPNGDGTGTDLPGFGHDVMSTFDKGQLNRVEPQDVQQLMQMWGIP